MGRANERIARTQETYVVNATNGWLESLERSLAMMKEYQVSEMQVTLSFLLTLSGCQEEARKSSISIRCIALKNAESQKGRLQGRGRVEISKG
jgi:MoaA/NifB/PqqE/SkfB family radical SAM enzyme